MTALNFGADIKYSAKKKKGVFPGKLKARDQSLGQRKNPT